MSFYRRQCQILSITFGKNLDFIYTFSINYVRINMFGYTGRVRSPMKNEYFTMKELPCSERPYEKCETYGTAALSDAELLSVIIRTGTINQRCVDVAMKVLDSHKLHKGLIGLYYLTLPELMKIDGVGKVKAVQLLCIAEIAKRLARKTKDEKIRFHSPKEIVDYFMEEMRVLQTEHVYLLMMDGRSRLLHYEKITNGTVNASMASPREIFKRALQYDAVYIVLLHNHPSGDPYPSPADIAVTKRMCESGQMMGIPLVDHIIIGDKQYISMKERGYIN